MNQVYTSGWLKAEHLQGHDAKVTIEEVTVQEFTDQNGRKKNQFVLKFVGKSARLGLNITNAKRIADNLGTTESAAWIGQTITIYPTETEMGGEIKPCIRVRPPKSPTQVMSRGQMTKPLSENPAPDPDDDIPF